MEALTGRSMKGIIIWLTILTLLYIPVFLWFIDMMLRGIRIF